jgi:transcriptional regulator with XRE-family HTH domain
MSRSPGRPRKPKKPIVDAPLHFDKSEEHGLTEMQTSFVWHYTEGACGMTEAARKAGYEFPSQAANILLNGKDFPNVVKAIKIKQEELAEKYAITPQKTGTMLWKVMESAYESGQFNAAVSAIKELNQLAGLSINRSQNININANLEKMSREQIKERLAQLLGADSSTYSAKDK